MRMTERGVRGLKERKNVAWKWERKCNKTVESKNQ